MFKSLLYALAFPLYSVLDSRVGFTVFFPTTNGWQAFTRGKLFPVREPRVWVLEYYRHFVPPTGGIVFDVGGELGYETEQLSRMVGKAGRVFVFECFPAHVKRLQELANKRKNIAVVEKACWDSATTLNFFCGHTPGSNTAVPDAHGQRGQELADSSKQSFTVQAEPLDQMWKTLTNGASVDFLKMDIEGAEYEALTGAAEMLRHTRFAVIAAYHLRDGVRTAERVAESLKAAGFTVRIDENSHVYGVRL